MSLLDVASKSDRFVNHLVCHWLLSRPTGPASGAMQSDDSAGRADSSDVGAPADRGCVSAG